MNDNYHKGHRARLKQKFLDGGIDALREHEILELLLFYAIPQRNTNEIAHQLIEICGGFSNVFDAKVSMLTQVPYVSENTAILIKLIPQIAAKYYEDKCRESEPITLDDICSFFLNKFLGVTEEKLLVACLDGKNTITSCVAVSNGITDAVKVNIKKIIEFTYQSNADSIVISHNHPNGNVTPSKDDILVTKHLLSVLKSVGITLVDHIVVANGKTLSMRDAGLF